MDLKMNIAHLTTEERRAHQHIASNRAKEALAKAHNTHPENWLTAREACEFLGISMPTLLKGRNDGKYVVVHHNLSRYYYDRRSLEAVLGAEGAGGDTYEA